MDAHFFSTVSATVQPYRVFPNSFNCLTKSARSALTSQHQETRHSSSGATRHPAPRQILYPLFSEKPLKVRYTSFRQDGQILRGHFRTDAHADIQENLERGLSLFGAQVVVSRVCEIAPRETFPPHDFLLRVEIPLEVIQPVRQGRRVNLMKCQANIIDPCDQRRRKFRVSYRTLFKIVKMNVLGTHGRLKFGTLNHRFSSPRRTKSLSVHLACSSTILFRVLGTKVVLVP